MSFLKFLDSHELGSQFVTLLLLDALIELALVGIGPVFFAGEHSNLEDPFIVGPIGSNILFDKLSPTPILIIHSLSQLIYFTRTISTISHIITSFDTIGILGILGY